MKKLYRWPIIIIFLLLFLPLVFNSAIQLYTSNYLVNNFKLNDKYKYVVVLGAGTIPVQERIDTASQILKNNPKVQLILSGKDKPEDNYYEMKLMKNYASEIGIDQSKIILSSGDSRTYESCKSLAKENVRYLIVTQAYHMDRALFICRSIGVDAYGFIAGSNSNDSLPDNRDSIRDVYALVPAIYDILSYLIQKHP